MKMEINFTADDSARRCGACTLCCKLLPVRSLGKLAGERCKHQRFGAGCTIYADRPHDCRTWVCRWQADPAATAGLPRPDRAHYVVDVMPDVIKLENEGQIIEIPVVQIWVDPAYPDAHRDPALRAYLAELANREGMAALIRFTDRDAMALFPPAMATDGQWHEKAGVGTPGAGRWSQP